MVKLDMIHLATLCISIEILFPILVVSQGLPILEQGQRSEYSHLSEMGDLYAYEINKKI